MRLSNKVRDVRQKKVVIGYGYDGLFCRKDCGYRYGVMVTERGMPPPSLNETD